MPRGPRPSLRTRVGRHRQAEGLRHLLRHRQLRRDGKPGFKAGQDGACPIFISQPTAKLVEIATSLIFAKNSGRKFQTHISNSGEQIPKHARQNSEDCRFPVSRNKVRSRGHRFIGTDFSILVSEFKFPPRSRIWDASHFSFLDSRCKSKDAHGLEIAQFEFQISRFTTMVSKRPLQIPNPPAPRFSFRVSGFKGGLRSWDLRRAHFSIPISQFSLRRLQRIERRYKTRFL